MSQPPDSAKEQRDLTATRLPLSRRSYLTLGGLASAALFLVGATYGLLSALVVDPKNEQIATLTIESRRIEAALQQEKRRSEDIQQRLDTLLENTERPLLHNPPFDGHVIGQDVTFEWEYPRHSTYQTYVLELRSLSKEDRDRGPHQSSYFNVLDPELKTFVYSVATEGYGEYAWRIIPGKRVYGNIKTVGLLGLDTVIAIPDGYLIAHGPGSLYSRFTLYRTAIERIRSTRRLRVGISPSRTSIFRKLAPTGELKGYDVEIISMISKELGQRLDLGDALAVEFVDLPFKQLLPALRQRKVDAVISSMTATKKRERDHGVVFSSGYFTTHQIFITKNRNNTCAPQEMRGQRVGVSEDTTNHRAAEFLKEDYEFEVDSSFTGYDGLYAALDSKEIDYALVDDILVTSLLNGERPRFFQCGEALDSALTMARDRAGNFYEHHIGYPTEQYAIAVFDGKKERSLGDCLDLAPGDKDLLCLINEILASQNGQTMISGVKERARRTVSD